MSTSNTADTSTSNSSQTNPWAPQAAALTSAFGDATNAYNTASTAVAPTNYTAQMDPTQIAAYNAMVAQGSNLTTPTQQAATGAALQNSGTTGVTGALTGLSNYDAGATNNTQSQIDAANQYVAGQNIPAQVAAAMNPAVQTANEVTMPGIEQNAAAGGNTNSTRTGIADGLVQQGLAEQDNSLTSADEANAYSQGLQLANTTANENNTSNLGALTSEGSVGNTAANTGVNAGTASVADQGALTSEAAAGGAGLTAAQQAELTNQQQQYTAATADPYAALSGLMGVIGSNNWGSSTTGTGTSDTTSTPSAWSTISGLMSSGGALMNGFSSPAGGGTPGTAIGGSVGPTVNRRSNLTPDRRPILTPLSGGFWR